MGNETAGTQRVPTPVKQCEGSHPTPAPSAPRFGAHLGLAVQDGGEYGMEQCTLGLAPWSTSLRDQPCCPRPTPGTTPGPTHSTPGDQL